MQQVISQQAYAFFRSLYPSTVHIYIYKAYEYLCCLTQANDSYYSLYSLHRYRKNKNVSCGIVVIKCLTDPEITGSKMLIYMSITEMRKKTHVLGSGWVQFNLFLYLWGRDWVSLYVQIMHTLWRIKKKLWSVLFSLTLQNGFEFPNLLMSSLTSKSYNHFL